MTRARWQRNTLARGLRRALLCLAPIVAFVPGPAEAEYGDVVLNRFAEKEGMRPVIFPHWFHRIRFRCKVCHFELGFKMRAGSNEVKMNDIIEGRFCGMCHDGQIAWSVENCTLGRAMAILGERWTVVVLREVFLGVRRFDDIRHHSGIPRQVLSNRLAALVDHGILHRVPYQAEGARTRHEYRLTEKGLELQPVLLAITAWGDRHLADPAGPPTTFVHRGDCEQPVHVDPDGYVVMVGTTPDELWTTAVLWLVVFGIVGMNVISVTLWWRRRSAR